MLVVGVDCLVENRFMATAEKKSWSFEIFTNVPLATLTRNTLLEYNITLDLQLQLGSQKFDPRHEYRSHNHYQELPQVHRNAA